jgi:hypothetical protein
VRESEKHTSIETIFVFFIFALQSKMGRPRLEYLKVGKGAWPPLLAWSPLGVYLLKSSIPKALE